MDGPSEDHKQPFHPRLVYQEAQERGDVNRAEQTRVEPKRAEKKWRDAITQYSRRDMTVDTGRLPAISALAAVMLGESQDAYVCGLWKHEMICQLMWSCEQVEDLAETRIRVSDAYIAPTWSWASRWHPIHYDHCPSAESTVDKAEVVEARSYVEGLNPFGAVSYGSIVLRGISCAGVLTVPKQRRQREIAAIRLKDGRKLKMGSHWCSRGGLDRLPVCCKRLQLGEGQVIDSLQRAGSFADEEAHGCSGEVRLLWLVNTCFLILAYSQREKGAFERLGIVFCDNDDSIPEAVRRTGMEEVKII
ncbi:hypothetical protein H2203_004537 [Taxawa tesnikishii (nom. ined.)]|nr:hypothetical protein H2203_004537 [Dothideales sp. JES 119]